MATPSIPQTTGSTKSTSSCSALYGSTLDKVLQYGVAKGYYPQSDVGAIKNRINQLAAKYQFSPDDFGVFTLIESDGMAPRAGADQVADNPNCIGIIQFCSWGGLRTIGKSREEVANSSTLQQLEFVDKYFSEVGVTKGGGLDELYLSVLNPASKDIKDPNADLGIGKGQADILYNSSGIITRNSIKENLTKLASERLQCLPDSSSASAPSASGGQPGIPSGIIGTNSAILSGENCPPPPFNQRDRIVYTGCKSKIASAVKGGLGYGYASNGVAYQGTPGASTNGLSPYTGPLRPGSLIVPTKGLVTSAWQDPSRARHFGIDIANDVGTPIYAAADGIVAAFTGGPEVGAAGYGQIVTLRHEGNVYTRYGHVEVIKVRPNQQVKQGQIIATMGSRGDSTGPHLHYEVRPNDSPVDPAQFYSENLSEGVNV